ncbi:hypothetical protein Bcav_1149 [Beutenbergia cavernae DSM 12333]|uniref:Glyoxalase-like domain-containing protein n=1 Tax=Beutenbergia cavernae (strain ATCC BAA-8 / DSM 12333 / CCUG 43141 / JCM 11478 / NBRC 16432 / NCIMB 13614 / HKI 0122) TaxID=471853 RepID=C5C105_BEUC1|nr:VOC family protein [Beutenbergia cavernae]ACQ79409.1 hypothetical protein Bcav_1149 [Beutenbergia cavernae DSM 12333]
MSEPGATTAERRRDPGDWSLLSEGVCAHFRTGSFAVGAELAKAVVTLVPADAVRVAIDVRRRGVTVRLPADGAGEGDGRLEAGTAARISAVARRLHAPSDSSALQSVEVAIDASDVPAVLPMWQAALGYEANGDSLVDPRGRNATFVFRPGHEPDGRRHRVHIDLATPYDLADARRAAALAAGGRVVTAARPWVIADAEGNETCAGGANPDLVPRAPGEREGWDGDLAEAADEPAEVGWREFHETAGVADWRMLDMGATAFFRAGSLAAGARLVREVSVLPGLGDRRPELDLRPDGVTVRLITLTPTFGGPASRQDVVLAREISTIARALGLVADPTGVQSLLVAIDALDIPAVKGFWGAALGYEPRPDTDQDLLDPLGHCPVVWFQQMDEPRGQRNRIRLEVTVPAQHAAARVLGAVAAGGHVVGDEGPDRTLIADVEGNELCLAAAR